jgi:hypothetical protein
LARRALLAAVWKTDAGDAGKASLVGKAPVYDWELSKNNIVSAVMPSRDDLIHISPVRVE